MGGREDDELAEMRNDPTMSQCCIRDLEHQRKGEALRQKLLAADRTSKALHPHGVVLAAPPLRDFPMTEQRRDEEEDSDEEVKTLREKRRQQLLQQARSAQRGEARGQLIDVPASQLLVRLQAQSRWHGPYFPVSAAAYALASSGARTFR